MIVRVSDKFNIISNVNSCKGFEPHKSKESKLKFILTLFIYFPLKNPLLLQFYFIS